MPRNRDLAAVEHITALSRERGFIPVDVLDEFLAVDKGFEARVETLVQATIALRLDPEITRHTQSLPPIERDRVRGNDDDSLRPYLSELRRIQRLEKTQEIAISKRYEFARRRLQRSSTSAGVGKSELKQITRGLKGDADPAAKKNGRGAAVDLVRSVRQHCAEVNAIRAQFVERNLHLVVSLAISYRSYGVPVLDLIQEGNAALIRAVEKFDWRKNVRFQTYATFWVRQAVERAIAFNRGIVRVPNYLQQKMRRLRREGVIPRRDGEVTLREMSQAFDLKPEVAGHLLETERSHFSLDVTLDEEGDSFASFLSGDSHEREVEELEFPMLRNRLNEVMETLTPQERRILELRYGLGGGDPLTLEEVGQEMRVSRERIRQLQVRAIRKLQRPALIDRLAGFV